MIHRLFGHVNPGEETKGKFRGGNIAFFELILTRTNAGVHKPLFEGYSYSLFKPRQT